MLTNLRVQNLAVVDDLSVEWQPGLNTVTGETGAGKSVIIGALTLLLGERADRSLIRSGSQGCLVEAIFEPPDIESINRLLDEADLPPCDDNNQLIIRRSINAAGGGRTVINDRQVTLQLLKKIGDQLVDMHGPHEHQSLFSRVFQQECLDAYGKHNKELDAYRHAYAQFINLSEQRSELEGAEGQINQEIELLSLQADEFKQATLTDEDDDIEKEHALAANAQRILELSNGICQTLNGEDDSGAFQSMLTARKMLQELSQLSEDAAEWEKEAAAVTDQIRALAEAVESAAQNIEIDPERLHTIEARMSLIYRLKRKYGGSLATVLDTQRRVEKRLEQLLHRNEEIERLNTAITAAENEVKNCGIKLHQARKLAATRMVKDVTKELRDLGFSHGAFDISINKTTPGPSGMDSTEFNFAPNAGEPMRPLRSIASSGEISRVMLALKTILAEHDRIPVLVFDEIDANVGGEMGAAIGRKLRKVAQCRQVLCITHLPQVAVCGTDQYVVIKQVEKGRTFTNITKLDQEARVNEIARMLSGNNPSKTTLQHAKEMLEEAGH